MTNIMVNLKPWQIGLLEAFGIVAYISIFSVVALNIEQIAPLLQVVPPMIGMMVMLIVLIFSAFLCGMLMLVTPLFLLLKGERAAALRTLLWSGLFLFIGLIILLAGAIVFQKFFT